MRAVRMVVVDPGKIIPLQVGESTFVPGDDENTVERMWGEDLSIDCWNVTRDEYLRDTGREQCMQGEEARRAKNVAYANALVCLRRYRKKTANVNEIMEHVKMYCAHLGVFLDEIMDTKRCKTAGRILKFS